MPDFRALTLGIDTPAGTGEWMGISSSYAIFRSNHLRRLATAGAGDQCRSPAPAIRLAAFLALWSTATLFLFLSGALKSEFGGNPDEAAHYVTGLMIHDYVAE